MSRQKTSKIRKGNTLHEIEEERTRIREQLKHSTLEKKYIMLSEESDDSSISVYTEEIDKLRKELRRLRKVKYDKVHEDENRKKRRQELKKKIDSFKI